MTLKNCIFLFLLILPSLSEVTQPKKTFDDKVADFYNSFKEEINNSRKLVNDELAPFFNIMSNGANNYYPYDNTGINSEFNNFSYNIKNPNHNKIY